jgi:membrane associated rhomboid family serine protease
MEVIEEIKFKFNQGNAIVRIILINVLVFLVFGVSAVILHLFNLAPLYSWFLNFLMLPASISKFIMQPWSLLTYMFLHEGFIHILFNMLWLYWFGNLFQQYLGNNKTYQAYFLGAIFGGLVYIISYNVFPVFANTINSTYALGASAGVLSLVFATATLLPNYEVFLFLLGSIRLKYIVLIVLFLDILSIPQGNAGGHIAHLGGAAFGYLFIKFIYSNSNIPNQLDKLTEKITGAFQKKSPLKIHHKGNSIRVDKGDKPSQSEIDSVLDKISKSGYDSLSKKEKEILFKAGKN